MVKVRLLRYLRRYIEAFGCHFAIEWRFKNLIILPYRSKNLTSPSLSDIDLEIALWRCTQHVVLVFADLLVIPKLVHLAPRKCPDLSVHFSQDHSHPALVVSEDPLGGRHFSRGGRGVEPWGLILRA